MATAVEVQDTDKDEVHDLNELDSALETSQKADDSEDDSTKDSDDEKLNADDKKDDKVDADDKGDKDDKGAGDEEKDPVAERLATLEEEHKEMKQMLRASQRQVMIDRSKLDRIGKRPTRVAGDVLDEDDKEAVDDKEDELSDIEKLQSALSNVGEARGDILELMLDNMELKKGTEDVRDVCTKSNFADVFEVIAKHQTSEKGGVFEENLLRVELEVWSMKHPYKYMYGVIKEYHPDYTESDKDAADGDPAAVLKTKEAEKKAKIAADKKLKGVDAMSSIANMGGGDADSQSGWTAERIDKLPEDELSTVPEKVYELYLRDELK